MEVGIIVGQDANELQRPPDYKCGKPDEFFVLKLKTKSQDYAKFESSIQFFFQIVIKFSNSSLLLDVWVRKLSLKRKYFDK